MNLTKILLVARKNLLEIMREPVLLGFTLLMPAFFMVINYIGYGASPKTATYPIWIMQNTPQADALVARLRAERYADGRPAYDLIFTRDHAAAEAALVEKRAAALLVFDEDTSGQVFVTMRGDALNMAFTRASVQIEAALVPLLEDAQGKPRLLVVSMQPLGLARPLSDFDAYTPGMMVFALLMLIPQTAMLVARELRLGTLRRLQLTLLKPAELLAGVSLAQMFFAVIQVLLMLVTALLFGFHNRGSLSLALGIGLVLSFSSIGMGLVVACFVRNDTDALNTGSVASMLQVFMSGAFFPMTVPAVFTLLGHQISPFDFLPATHGMLALQQVLTGGAGLEKVVFRLAAATLLSVLYFLLGVWIFTRRQRVYSK